MRTEHNSELYDLLMTSGAAAAAAEVAETGSSMEFEIIALAFIPHNTTVGLHHHHPDRHTDTTPDLRHSFLTHNTSRAWLSCQTRFQARSDTRGPATAAREIERGPILRCELVANTDVLIPEVPPLGMATQGPQRQYSCGGGGRARGLMCSSPIIHLALKLVRLIGPCPL